MATPECSGILAKICMISYTCVCYIGFNWKWRTLAPFCLILLFILGIIRCQLVLVGGNRVTQFSLIFQLFSILIKMMAVIRIGRRHQRSFISILRTLMIFVILHSASCNIYIYLPLFLVHCISSQSINLSEPSLQVTSLYSVNSYDVTEPLYVTFTSHIFPRYCHINIVTSHLCVVYNWLRSSDQNVL